jgi:hypothetical protein
MVRIGYERLTRWGCGISYHEFELVLGEEVHQYVIAEGFEPEIEHLIGLLPDDLIILTQLKMFASNVHKAFGRRALHFNSSNTLTIDRHFSSEISKAKF